MTIIRHKDATPSMRVARSDFAVTYAPPFGGVRHMSGAFSANVVESSRGADLFHSLLGFLIEASRSQAMRGGDGGRVTSPVRSSYTARKGGGDSSIVLAGRTDGGGCASLDTELRCRKCVGTAKGKIREGSNC